MDIGYNLSSTRDNCTHWVRIAVISLSKLLKTTSNLNLSLPKQQFPAIPCVLVASTQGWLSSGIFVALQVVEDHIITPSKPLLHQIKQTFFNLSLHIMSCRVLISCRLQGPFQFCGIPQIVEPQTGHRSSGVGPAMSHRRKSLPLICETWYNTELTTTRNSRLVGISKSKAMSHSFCLQIQSIYGTVSWNMMTYRSVVFFTQKLNADSTFFSETLDNTQREKCRILQILLWKITYDSLQPSSTKS